MDDVAVEPLLTAVIELNTVAEITASVAEIHNSDEQSLKKLETPTKSGTNESKNSSLEEDLLGANSLLMSESDDEEDNESTQQQIPKQQKLESTKSVNMNDIVNNEMDCGETTQANNDLMPVLDETNNEEMLLLNGQQSDIAANPAEISNEDQQEGNNIQKKKKFSTILDSDSDEGERSIASKEVTNMRSKFSALIDSESDSETEKKPMKPVKEKKFKLIDSDSDENEKPAKEKKTKKLTKKRSSSKSALIDSDSASNSDTELSGKETDTIDQEELDNLQQMDVDSEKHASGMHKKPIRASAQKALDEMQAIQSEQQRLHREAHISVPYHKPKRYTLQEFLQRRTIIKPAVENESSPAAAILKRKSLKMSPEELEEYAKLMEERAKEATEFFKSESESEEEELKDNVGVMDVDAEQQVTENSKTEGHKEKTNVELDEEPDKNAQIVENVEKDTEVDQISSQPLVTEVLELPNIDLSALHVNERDEITPDAIHITEPVSSSLPVPSHLDIGDLKKQIFSEQRLTESPTIKGDANMIIDLESGDMTEKRSTGADNLLQRLLATHRTRKPKTSETVNILSNENGKFEMTTVNIHVADEDGVNKDHKPGAAYVKLKENLKTLIKKKRLEEMQKKQEDESEYYKCLEGEDDDEDGDEYEGAMEEYELDDDEKVSRKKRRSDEIIIDDEENAVDVSEDVGEEDAIEEFEEAEEANELELEAVNDEAEVDEMEEEPEATEDPTAFGIEPKSDDDTDEDSSDSEDANKESSSNVEFKLPLTATQRKSRIIKAFAADSDIEDDDMDLLKTQIPVVQSNIVNTIFGNIESPLKSCLSMSCSEIGIGNTQELLGLCSGSFDVTQNHTSSSGADTVIISQIPMTQQSHLNDASEELLGLCSGTFEESNKEEQETQTVLTTLSSPTQCLKEDEKAEKPKNVAKKILSSDEEGLAASVAIDTQNRIKKLRKKLQKRQVKLGFSDDEEENDAVAESRSNNANNNLMNKESCDEDETEIPQTYVEYDSEENEIIVEMTKGDRIKRAEKFFEKEAELSESDWGSADEDEKNMDTYDIELGDEDEFDRGKLQQELGQIHARKMLDEDIREVRKIQEMLFEDEETDGVGRQRQFRWKNAENGFSLEDMRAGGNGEDGFDGESGDEEQKQEHLWRKIRFEREQLLKEQGLKESSQEFVTKTLGIHSPLTTIISESTSVRKNVTPIQGSNGKKFEVITRKMASTIVAKQNVSPFLISTNTTSTKTATIVGPTTPTSSILKPKTVRGSFLTRDKDTLEKFANMTKSKAATGFDDNETAGTVSTKGKNFVFTTLTKEEHEHLKRKAEDLLNSSTEIGTNFVKKPRVSGDKQCLIDQLLM